MRTDELYHRGTPHEGAVPHSGRYEYGSGENPEQHVISLAATIKQYKRNGLTDKEIADLMDMSNVREVRDILSMNKYINKQTDIEKYSEYIKEHPNASRAEIAVEALGKSAKNESYVRILEKQMGSTKVKAVDLAKEQLESLLNDGLYVDIGRGAHTTLQVSEQVLKNAVNSLEADGYVKFNNIQVEQVTNPGKNTTLQVICPKGTEWKDVMQNKDKISLPTGHYIYDEDGVRTGLGLQKPVSVDSSRIFVRYAEDGGLEKDGTIELRRGVEDLSLGNSSYAQVRIAVDDKAYMKGMAIYSDTVPDGYDVVYNVHRSAGTELFEPKNKGDETVFKPMKKNKETGEIDWDNPFGALLKTEDGEIVGQYTYKDKDGNEKLSPINLVKTQSDWDKYSKTLASQFLSKQSLQLINKQLNKSYADKEEEFNSIKVLTNPEVKQSLLNSFADDCDASAVHLKAAALPNQTSKVILPLTTIKDDQVFAPTYEDGSQVVLIRYPHEGIFEIPMLTVNNKNKEGLRIIGNDAEDAIGISATAASQLSGADFDGDSVVVIPYADANGNIINKINFTKYLDDLNGFDPQTAYPYREGMQEMKKTNLEMGKISNLITDMTLQGASTDEMVRAVKHSMVVIDAEKHHLDYTRSYKENQIAALKEKYQGGKNAGAGTIISRSKGESDPYPARAIKTSMQVRTDEEEIWLQEHKDNYDSLSSDDKQTYATILRKLTPTEYKQKLEGKKIYYETGAKTNKKVVDKETGEVTYVKVPKMEKTTKMDYTDDAFTLVSKTDTGLGLKKEEAYATYANKLKQLANDARAESLKITPSSYSKESARIYAKEVASLNDKYQTALSNAPLERQAQVYANVVVSNKLRSNPDLKLKENKSTLKKLKQQALTEGRNRVNAHRHAVTFTDQEWEAVQAGAISSTKLKDLLKKADMDQVKKLATPSSSNNGLTNSQIARIKTLRSNGATLYEIANKMGISYSTVKEYL